MSQPTRTNEYRDPIPETVYEALERWDAGKPVFSVEMGGLGPSYEQAIQTMAFEIMRAIKDLPWAEDDPKEDAESSRRMDHINRVANEAAGKASEMVGGATGAMVGAAKSLAHIVCERGYRAALRDPEVADRLIQVARVFPPVTKDRARLIAAAPDLLDACKRLLLDLREARDTGSCHRSRDSQIADLAAAIAKAEGGAA